MTAQVFSSTMSQHPFPSAFSSPLASPSPSKENQRPLFPSFPAQAPEASSSSSNDAGPSRLPSDDPHTDPGATEAPRQHDSTKTRSQRVVQSRRQSRPRLHSLQSLNSGPASPSLTEQDSGHAYISTSRFLTSHPSMSRASSRNAVETLAPLAESSSTTGKLRVSASNDTTAESQHRPAPLRQWSATQGESSTRRLTTSPTLDTGLSEFGQMGAPYGVERNDVGAKLRNFHSSTGALLRRSHTITSGINSMGNKRHEEAPFRRSPPENAVTFGPSSGSRNAPLLAQRRQTVSNVSPTADRGAASSQTKAVSPLPSRTLSYPQPSPNATSSTLSPSSAPTHLRERGTLPQNQLEAKVVILGSQGVGKTSLVHRYTSGQFTVASTPSTIGASFLTKKLIVDGVKVRLQLWDTAGQERFRSMAPMYYRGSHAAVIVYDITSMSSFLDVRTWIEELKKNMTTDLVIHVVGAKLDLAWTGRQVELEFARATVRSWLQPYQTQPILGGAEEGASPPSSRLSGLGSLAMGSASRLTSFQRTAAGGANKPSSAASTTSAGSGSSDAGIREPMLELDLSWDVVELSEVSAKSDRGIEEVFLAVTKKLVERRSQIELERRMRVRNSVFLSDEGQVGEAATATAGWGCCA